MRHRSWFMTIPILVFIASSMAAEERAARGREPWEYPLEERLELRLDRAGRAARLNAFAAQGHAVPSAMKDRIDGHEHPELFLPHELFDSLIHDAENPQTDGTRYNDRRLRQAGFEPAAFWRDLRAVSARYLAVNARFREIKTKTPAASPEVKRALLERCGARIDALEAARKHFGADRFDGFLYQYLAPNAVISYADTPEEGEDYETQLRARAGGCR